MASLVAKLAKIVNIFRPNASVRCQSITQGIGNKGYNFRIFSRPMFSGKTISKQLKFNPFTKSFATLGIASYGIIAYCHSDSKECEFYTKYVFSVTGLRT